MIDFTNMRMRLYLETDNGEPVVDGPINGLFAAERVAAGRGPGASVPG